MEADNTSPSGKRIDLSRLQALSGGDMAFELKYISSFLSLIQTELNRIETAVAQNDGKLLCETLHRIKPQLDFYRISGALNAVKNAENLLTEDYIISAGVQTMVDFIFKEIIFACAEFEIVKNNYGQLL
jgi:hypothetical protein